jgi:hypothetical protein
LHSLHCHFIIILLCCNDQFHFGLPCLVRRVRIIPIFVPQLSVSSIAVCLAFLLVRSDLLRLFRCPCCFFPECPQICLVSFYVVPVLNIISCLLSHLSS